MVKRVATGVAVAWLAGCVNPPASGTYKCGGTGACFPGDTCDPGTDLCVAAGAATSTGGTTSPGGSTSNGTSGASSSTGAATSGGRASTGGRGSSGGEAGSGTSGAAASTSASTGAAATTGASSGAASSSSAGTSTGGGTTGGGGPSSSGASTGGATSAGTTGGGPPVCAGGCPDDTLCEPNGQGVPTCQPCGQMGQPCCASASVACFGTSYFIDCADGNDANDGTEEISAGPGSGPWLHQPYMQGFTGNYTHSPGDRFVFKGGVTCPNAYFPLVPQQGGNEGAADYYGVDPSWFAGASWSRPIFDMQGQLVGMNVDGNDAEVEVPSNWVTFDNLELKGHYWTGNGWIYDQNASIATPSDPDGLTVENCYFHGWTHDAYDDGGTPDSFTVLFGDGNYNVAEGCVIEDSDGDGASGTATGNYWTVVSGSSIHDMAGGIVGAGAAYGNQIFDLHNSYDPTAGPVASLAYYTYDNVVHDIGDDVGPLVVAFWAGPGTTPSYAWNNVAWHMNGVPLVIAAQYCDECDAGSVYLWNNTLAATSSDPCIDLVNTWDGNVDVLDVRNTHCITNGTEILTIDPNVSANAIPDAGNILMTDNVAAFQGYAAGNAFAPTSASDSTVDAGQNLSSQCSQTLPPICGDPEPACNPTAQSLCADVDGVPRPAGGNWDVGAYEFQ